MSENSLYDFKPITDEEENAIRRLYRNRVHEYMRVGPKGYLLPTHFKTHANEVWNMPVRGSDIFVVAYGRSGTTWTQELVWLIGNDLDFEKAKSIILPRRFLEHFAFKQPTIEVITKKQGLNDGETHTCERFSKTAVDILAETPSPRFIKTHLPISLLPKGALETSKVIYVARDPRDVAVSYYHFINSFQNHNLDCDFKEFYYEIFVKDLVWHSPILEHIKEAWAQRNHPNLLFLTYEEMSKDLKGAAKRVCSFLDKQYTYEQLDQLCDYLTFANFQKFREEDTKMLKKLGVMKDVKNSFVRKGKVGGWREYFDPEMEDHAAKWMEKNLRGTGLKFQE